MAARKPIGRLDSPLADAADAVGVLRRIYAAHFARVQAEEARRLAAARRRLARSRAA